MPPDLTIRPATPADDDALWALLEPVFRAGDTYAVDPDIGREAALAYWVRTDAAVFLAETEGVALGTFYIRANAGGGGAHVANAGFVTAPPARGRGIARAMLRHAETEARRRGFRAMQFNFVVETNAAALHIWRSEGYAGVGRLPGVFHHPREGRVDALVMFKPLEGPA
ncbi:MAG: N-acetyltransferase [Paracoccaceae bacterium]|jgi:ribosomal protein S18 acetylase RimI-like enzyme|nr:N-acetyltransferase [Paracoccaceae bacterium]